MLGNIDLATPSVLNRSHLMLSKPSIFIKLTYPSQRLRYFGTVQTYCSGSDEGSYPLEIYKHAYMCRIIVYVWYSKAYSQLKPILRKERMRKAQQSLIYTIDRVLLSRYCENLYSDECPLNRTWICSQR